MASAVVDYAIPASSFRPVAVVRTERQHHRVQTSVIMPAFNEEAGIGDALRVLTEIPEFGTNMEIVVAANGCTDRTAEVARSFGVRVVEIATPSKTAALNAADEVATGDVRIYLDADVPATAELLRGLAAAVARPGIEAAVPRPVQDTSASTWPVRAFYAINSRLPVFRGRLFGRGIIAVSTAARYRFARFPEITADDMVLDAVVAAGEKTEIDLPVRVVAPRTTGDLIRRVARARDGNAEFWRFAGSAPDGFPALPDPVAGPSTTSWMRDVVLRAPWLIPAAIVYVAVVLLAERKRRSPSWDVRSGWGRPAEPVRIPAQRAGSEAPAKVANRE
jgi:glycosyl transferase family 2